MEKEILEEGEEGDGEGEEEEGKRNEDKPADDKLSTANPDTQIVKRIPLPPMESKDLKSNMNDLRGKLDRVRKKTKPSNTITQIQQKLQTRQWPKNLAPPYLQRVSLSSQNTAEGQWAITLAIPESS